MSIDTTQITIALMGVLTAVITTVVVPWVKSRTTTNQQAIIAALARTAVYAAQQLYKDNKQKKAYAEEYIIKQLKKYELSLDADAVSAAIEAALKEIKTEIYGVWNGASIAKAMEMTSELKAVEDVTVKLDGSEVAEAVRQIISEFFEKCELVKEPVSGE